MNKEETKKAIEIMQAFVDGKAIVNSQGSVLIGGDLYTPFWDWGNRVSEYSVKPEPREYNVYLNASEQPFDVTHATVDTKQGMRTVRVREVTE